MVKLIKTFKAIKEIIKNPWLLNKILEEDSVWLKYLKKQYGFSGSFPVISLDKLVSQSTIDKFAFLGGGSLPTDILLLRSLAISINECKYFEIGTWRGESVINVSDVTKECYTLNLSKEEILSLGLSEKYADLHGFFSKKDKNIIHLTGNSATYDFAGLNKKFDLVFIDGDHHFDMVKSDTENVFKHLIHDESIVVWHDYAYSPEQVRAEVMAGIYEGVPSNQRKHLYHVGNTMCAIYTKGAYNTYNLEYPETPKTLFKVTVESNSIEG